MKTMKINYKYLVCWAAMSLFCFVLWMGVLGGAAQCGILDLDAAAACEDTVGNISFIMICLVPPFFMGNCAADIVLEEIEGGLFGIKKQD